MPLATSLARLANRSQHDGGATPPAPGPDAVVTQDHETGKVVLSGVVKDYGDTRAIRGVSLTVREGETFALLGPSGCGKSTLLRCIAGLEDITGGEISVAGRCVADAATGKTLPAEKRNMAMVFQSYAIWPHMTVAQNVGFALKLRRMDKREIDRRVLEMLRITGLEALTDRPANRLSGGQQQRVALARALAYMPEVLLLDEPLSNLDTNLREEMRREIARLQSTLGVTIIFVTHDRHEAMALATRVAIINEGRVEQLGTPAEVYERPRTAFVRDFLGNSFSVPGQVVVDADVPRVAITASLGGGSMEVPAQVAEGLALESGTAVEVGGRPEDLTMHDARPQGPAVGATITEALYQGTHIEYTVALGDAVLRINGPRSRPRAIGDDVWLELDPARCWVWPQA
jgi:ABC-type Fe3+/spermidine/putrescine transport system ATPase subunit